MYSHKLSRSISKLPQELQDYINTYNAEHRILMKEVCKTISYNYKQIECHNCTNTLRRIDTETIIIPGLSSHYYCSMNCFYDDRHQ
jgi:hypothetical protein